MTDSIITAFGATADVQRRFQAWEIADASTNSKTYTAHEGLVINLDNKNHIVRPGMIVQAFKDVERTKTGLYHVCEILRHQEQQAGAKTSFFLSVHNVVKACEVFDDYGEKNLHATDLLISTFQFRIDAETIICVEPVVRLAEKTRVDIPAGYRVLIGTYKFEEIDTDQGRLIVNMIPAEDVRRFYSIARTSPNTQKPINLVKPVSKEQSAVEQEAQKSVPVHKDEEDKDEPISSEAVIAGQNNAAPAEKADLVVQKESAQTEHAGDKRKEMHEQDDQVEKNGDKTDHVQASIMSPQKRTKVPLNATWGPKAVPLKAAGAPDSKTAGDAKKANALPKKSAESLKDSVSAIQEACKVLEKATADANKAEVQYLELEKQLKQAEAKIAKQKSLVEKAKKQIAALVRDI